MDFDVVSLSAERPVIDLHTPGSNPEKCGCSRFDICFDNNFAIANIHTPVFFNSSFAISFILYII